MCSERLRKLDLLNLMVSSSIHSEKMVQPLVALAPHVKDLRNLGGTSGARSICLLVHAYGSSLLLLPGASTDGHAVCDDVLQYLLGLTTKLKLNNIKLRFQVLTALQLKVAKKKKQRPVGVILSRSMLVIRLWLRKNYTGD